ncbi:hypothetical protein CNR27_02660 [Luteimonas chenhongjianii]|uniref:Uncharacterized protein n=1 Tax=Luteimonas chenhongjianii TaxID=2006110 RepID=A0A290XBL3_9GAMM|nr:hypothetical protein [Luteimonas chenhongjianii]ATD66489.1 hypothetical protein CNR27_02660 [Luteimonas chenhongjianii]
MQARGLGAALALVLGVAGSATANDGQTREVQSQDGSFTGEIVGTPAQGSKFAQLQIGTSMQDVQELMDSAPDRSHSYESGKRWIPFYFGNDVTRLQALCRGEGCLIFTSGNIWGGGSQLIQIEVDPAGDCYQP